MGIFGGRGEGSSVRMLARIYIYNTESEWCGIKEEAALWPFRPRPLVGGTVAPRSWHFAGDNIWPRKSGRKEAAVVGQGSVRLPPPSLFSGFSRQERSHNFGRS